MVIMLLTTLMKQLRISLSSVLLKLHLATMKSFNLHKVMMIFLIKMFLKQMKIIRLRMKSIHRFLTTWV